QEFVVALDGLAIIVRPHTPATRLDIASIRARFAGDIRHWRQAGGRNGPVRLAARDGKSGTQGICRMPGLGSASLPAEAQRLESTAEVARRVASDPDAIGFVGLGGVGGARTLAIGDAETPPLHPEVAAVAVEDYLLTRRLYLYLRNDASRDA